MTRVELIQIITATIGALFTVYAVRGALLRVRAAIGENIDLRPIAIRRMRHQVGLLLTQLTLVIAGSIALSLPVGETQAVMRSYAMSVVSIILLSLSLLEHWDPISGWIHRQWMGGETPRRRASDPPPGVQLKRKSDDPDI